MTDTPLSPKMLEAIAHMLYENYLCGHDPLKPDYKAIAAVRGGNRLYTQSELDLAVAEAVVSECRWWIRQHREAEKEQRLAAANEAVEKARGK